MTLNNEDIKIGCQGKRDEDWFFWLSSDKEYYTSRNQLSFPFIAASIRAAIAYKEELAKCKVKL